MDIIINGVSVRGAKIEEKERTALVDTQNSFTSAEGEQVQPIIAWKRNFSIDFGMRTATEIDAITEAVIKTVPAELSFKPNGEGRTKVRVNILAVPAKTRLVRRTMTYYTLKIEAREV